MKELPILTGRNPLALMRNWRDLWNNHLRAHFRRSSIIAGPGIQIDRRACGTIISAARRGGKSNGQSAFVYNGPFAVTYDEVTKKLRVSSGWINRNGLEMILMEPQTIDPGKGYLCICSEPVDKRGNWSKPMAAVRNTPTQCAWPVAEIDKTDTGEWQIQQYYCTMALIFYSAKCPIAEL